MDEKDSRFLVYFDGKQCRDSFQQAHSCVPSSVCILLPFGLYLFRRLLLDLDAYGGNDLDGMFPLFCRQGTQELAPKLTVIFRHAGG